MTTSELKLQIGDLERIANEGRRLCVRYGHGAGPGGAHFGPALSLVDLMTLLVSEVAPSMAEDTSDRDRDRLILSKGHGSLSLYVALHQFGFIDFETMQTCEKDGSLLPGQPIRNVALGIEFSSGSLGMGLGFGAGLALSARMDGSNRRIYVVMGDGETNEGSVWESALFLSQQGLSNVTAFIDANDLQSDGKTEEILFMEHESLWKACGGETFVVDGHSMADLKEALVAPRAEQPRAIIARTVKGKGVSFMEGNADWHHGSLTPDLLDEAMSDLTDPTKQND